MGQKRVWPPEGADGAELVGGDFGPEVKTLVHGSASEPGKWQATRFAADGQPFGHTVYASLAEAVVKEIKWGAKFRRWSRAEKGTGA